MGSGSFKSGALYGHWYTSGSAAFTNKGKVTEMGTAFAAVNEKMAVDLQQSVAQALRQSLRRPSVSSGMLEKAILDRRNRKSSYEGFGVGIAAFLDKSAAKYWWQIEKGTDVHKGQILQGLWADAVSTNSKGKRKLIGPVSAFRSGAGQQQGFRPFGRASARAQLKKQGATGPVKGVIKNPITAHDYFETGWKQWGGVEEVRRRYDAEFKRLGIKVTWGKNGTPTATKLLKWHPGGKGGGGSWQ